MRVKIVSDGCTPNTVITDLETGKVLDDVVSVHLSITANQQEAVSVVLEHELFDHGKETLDLEGVAVHHYKGDGLRFVERPDGAFDLVRDN